MGKFCECGCGNLAPIATMTSKRSGWIKGEPKRFISGHNQRRLGNGMSDCHPNSPHRALGMCSKCYTKWNYQQNKEKRNSQIKEWRSNNPDKVKKYKENPEYRKLTVEWRLNNPEASRSYGSKRRSLKTKAGGEYTAEEFLALCEFYGNICLCCKRTKDELLKLNLALVADHVVPIIKGGTSNIDNIQPLCHSWKSGTVGGCNNSKRAKIIDYRV